jgi:FeS assembly SUF system protein
MSETTSPPDAAEVQPNRPDLDLAPGIPPEEMDDLTEKIITALKTVFDPEIPVDIYELGLIYNVAVDDSRLVDIEMTLTAPGCPVAGDMPRWVENAVSAVQGISGVNVRLVFEPAWNHGRMSDVARVALDMW